MEIFEELLRRVSWPWLLGASVVLIAFGQTSFVPRFFKQRVDERVSSADRLSAEQRDLLDRLQEQVEQEHQWRMADATYYQDQIRELRRQLAERDTNITKMVETSMSSERGNARLRHALANVLQYIASLRHLLRKRQMSVPPYDGWRDLLNINDDLDEKLRELFGEGPNEPCP